MFTVYLYFSKLNYGCVGSVNIKCYNDYMCYTTGQVLANDIKSNMDPNAGTTLHTALQPGGMYNDSGVMKHLPVYGQTSTVPCANLPGTFDPKKDKDGLDCCIFSADGSVCEKRPTGSKCNVDLCNS